MAITIAMSLCFFIMFIARTVTTASLKLVQYLSGSSQTVTLVIAYP
jgi:hypothetical protein